MNPPTSFYWHDYETFGIDPARDGIAQFAGRRTTADLEPIGEPLMLHCQPLRDRLPHPQSCFITGISPQMALSAGVPEPEFIRRIHAQFMQPGTCGVGYNSIRFDDEFTRYALYRNFYDPYEREWRGGNSRWDLIDVARLCAALRPDGIEWPLQEDGTRSFRLELLTAANGLNHAHAHDALSDVDATIAFARLLRERQPKLWAHALRLRDKQFAASYLDVRQVKPVLHVSSKIPSSRHCIALVAPLARHARNANEVIVFDLSEDPAELIELDVESLRERIFISNDDLPEGVRRIPLKGVHVNKSPMLAPLEVLRPSDAERLGLNLASAEERCAKLRALHAELEPKIREVFAPQDREPGDAESSLYAGFLGERDKQRCTQVREAAPERLAQMQGLFEDTRYNELLLRYRARHYPDTLNAAEAAQWNDYVERKLHYDTGLASLTLDQYREILAGLRVQAASPARRELIEQLARWPSEAGLTAS